MNLDVWVRVGMIRIELGTNMLSKTEFSATAGSRNRFLCGRNRVPGTNSREVEFLYLRNRLLLGRNRVPNVNFTKKIDFHAGTGSLVGGTEFLVYFSAAWYFCV